MQTRDENHGSFFMKKGRYRRIAGLNFGRIEFNELPFDKFSNW